MYKNLLFIADTDTDDYVFGIHSSQQMQTLPFSSSIHPHSGGKMTAINAWHLVADTNTDKDL